MLTKEIYSLQHPVVKHLVKLRNDRQFRFENQTALVVGNKLIEEIGQTCRFKTLICQNDHFRPLHVNAEQIYTVPETILKKITGVENPEPLAAEIEIPPTNNLQHMNLILALDGVNDPGNLGTLLRTALAFGWQGAFITEKSVDPFNEKALRSAKGATFKLPLSIGSSHELENLIIKNQMHVYVADMEGAPLESISSKAPTLLILGNEAQGVDDFFKNRYPRVRIPINSQMESLNVAIAGGILMYFLGKKK